MQDPITLKGSTRTITEFFEYSINTILYQRGVYPPEDFTTVKKYDSTFFRTHDDELKAYIRKILVQVHRWLLGGKCNKLVLCIIDKDDGDVVERWSFDVQHMSKSNDGDDEKDSDDTNTRDSVDYQETQSQIRALMRQIIASVTFLPELAKEGGKYTFSVLAYTDADAKVPLEWSDSDAKEIANAEIVQFKSFSTSEYKVGAQVSYRY